MLVEGQEHPQPHLEESQAQRKSQELGRLGHGVDDNQSLRQGRELVGLDAEVAAGDNAQHDGHAPGDEHHAHEALDEGRDLEEAHDAEGDDGEEEAIAGVGERHREEEREEGRQERGRIEFGAAGQTEDVRDDLEGLNDVPVGQEHRRVLVVAWLGEGHVSRRSKFLELLFELVATVIGNVAG